MRVSTEVGVVHRQRQGPPQAATDAEPAPVWVSSPSPTTASARYRTRCMRGDEEIPGEGAIANSIRLSVIGGDLADPGVPGTDARSSSMARATFFSVGRNCPLVVPQVDSTARHRPGRPGRHRGRTWRSARCRRRPPAWRRSYGRSGPSSDCRHRLRSPDAVDDHCARRLPMTRPMPVTPSRPS